jgi:hypothetical protein
LLKVDSFIHNCPRGTTRLPLDGLSWNLIFEYFSKTLPRKLHYKLTRVTGTLYEDECNL